MSAPYLPLKALTEGVALRALTHVARAVGLPLAVRVVFEALTAMAYAPHPRRVGPGEVEVWYVDLEAATGLSRGAVQRAMVLLRRLGLVRGRPNAPDPTDDWHRDRARYVLMVPRMCGRLLAQIAYGQRKTRSNDALASARPSFQSVPNTPPTHKKEPIDPPLAVDNGPPDAAYATPAAIRRTLGWPEHRK